MLEVTVLLDPIRMAVSNTCGMPVAVGGGIMSTAVEPIQTSQALAVTGPQPEEAVKPVSKTATL